MGSRAVGRSNRTQWCPPAQSPPPGLPQVWGRGWQRMPRATANNGVFWNPLPPSIGGNAQPLAAKQGGAMVKPRPRAHSLSLTASPVPNHLPLFFGFGGGDVSLRILANPKLIQQGDGFFVRPFPMPRKPASHNRSGAPFPPQAMEVDWAACFNRFINLVQDCGHLCGRWNRKITDWNPLATEADVGLDRKLLELRFVRREGVPEVVPFIGSHQVDDLANAAANQCAAPFFGLVGVDASRKKARQKQPGNNPVASRERALRLMARVVHTVQKPSVARGRGSVLPNSNLSLRPAQPNTYLAMIRQ